MRETLMTPKSTDRIVAVRVDADATIVAVVARDSSRVLRVRRVPGGFAAIDDRLMELVDAEVPGGLPRSSEPRVLAARSRLREAVAAARVRLLEDESTLIPVRFPGSMSFATLERAAVAEAAAPEVEAAAEVVRELADGAAIVALDGVATAPGLLDALPGSLVELDEVDAEALDALLDTAPLDTVPLEPGPPEAALPEPEVPEAEVHAPEADALADEPADPEPEPVARPRAVVVLSRAWPVAAATASILLLGGAAAALGYTTHQPAPTSVERTVPATSSGAGSIPASGATAGSVGAAPTDPASPVTQPQPGDQVGTTRRAPANPGQAAAAAPSAPEGGSSSSPSGGSTPSDTSSPTSTPTGTSTPDPTPSDTGTSSPSPSPTSSDTPTPSDSPTDGLTITIPLG
jgi:hypothetical protein